MLDNSQLNEELSQAKARIAIFLVCVVYVLFYDQSTNLDFTKAIYGLTFLGLYSGFIYFNILKYPGVYDLRRYSNITVDISCATFIIFAINEHGAFFYPVFLWIIVGNGIRFGIKYLFIAQVIGLVGFWVLIYQSEYWKSIPYVANGLLMSTAVLPLFFVKLISRLHTLNNHLDDLVLDKTKKLNNTIQDLEESNESLKIAEKKLAQYNQELEQEVKNRTQELQQNLDLLAEKSLDLQTEIAQREKSEKKVEYLAMHDELTGLVNRTKLRNEIPNIFSLAKRQNSKVGILFIDLDGFKQINDTKGHEIGDVVLIMVAERMLQVVRDFDIVSRFGGDEFVIILPHCDSSEEVLVIAERIRTLISEPIADLALQISCSIGVSCYPNHSSNWLELLTFADKAMYISKNKGKNTVELFKKALD